jgi:diguanylate cyclase (GGDEF)-like protein
MALDDGEVSTLSTAWERGVAAGVFYLAGSTALLFALFDPGVRRGPLLVVAASAALIGLGSLRFHRWYSPAVTHVVVATASVLIGVSVVLAGGGLASVLIIAEYTLVAMYVALLGSPRDIAGHLTWAMTTLLVAALLLWPPMTVLPIAGVFVTVCGTVTVVSALLANRLRESATTDPLTGLVNRGGFDASLRAAAATVLRTGEPLSLVLLDLDDFKQVNDRGGHAAGDTLLCSAAAAWSSQLRARDTLARLGGDEFAVVMPGADAEQARLASERLATATPEVGCSVGISSWASDRTLDELLADADDDLYRAKGHRRPTSRPPLTRAGS